MRREMDDLAAGDGLGERGFVAARPLSIRTSSWLPQIFAMS